MSKKKSNLPRKRSSTICLPKWCLVKRLHHADEEGREQRDSNIREAAVERMRGVAERRENDDED